VLATDVVARSRVAVGAVASAATGGDAVLGVLLTPREAGEGSADWDAVAGGGDAFFVRVGFGTTGTFARTVTEPRMSGCTLQM
jgi:hypothetical protein